MSINKEAMIGGVMVFRGDDQVHESSDTIIDITEMTRAGDVEIAFDLPNRQRVYVRANLAELVRIAVTQVTG